MYSLEQIKRGIQNPREVGYELNRLCHTRGGVRGRNPNGTDIIDEDWDNLILLDACRYDYFSEFAEGLSGELEYRYSLGSATKQFIRENFREKTLYDTVYVGANTWFLKLQHRINAAVHHFIDLQNGDYEVEWADEELKVVTPETVSRHASRASEEFPNKRLIIHYLQPHHPFIGPKGQEYLPYQSNSLREVVQMAGKEVDRHIVREAYRENLERVLSAVESVLPELHGKTVITADHGEMLGERFQYVPMRGYGHPIGVYNEYTTKVPWNVIQADERKEIIAEQPTQQQETDMSSIDDRLRDLGYKV